MFVEKLEFELVLYSDLEDGCKGDLVAGLKLEVDSHVVELQY